VLIFLPLGMLKLFPVVQLEKNVRDFLSLISSLACRIQLLDRPYRSAKHRTLCKENVDEAREARRGPHNQRCREGRKTQDAEENKG
jgi:hypothetical protein